MGSALSADGLAVRRRLDTSVNVVDSLYRRSGLPTRSALADVLPRVGCSCAMADGLASAPSRYVRASGRSASSVPPSQVATRRCIADAAPREGYSAVSLADGLANHDCLDTSVSVVEGASSSLRFRWPRDRARRPRATDRWLLCFLLTAWHSPPSRYVRVVVMQVSPPLHRPLRPGRARGSTRLPPVTALRRYNDPSTAVAWRYAMKSSRYAGENDSETAVAGHAFPQPGRFCSRGCTITKARS